MTLTNIFISPQSLQHLPKEFREEEAGGQWEQSSSDSPGDKLPFSFTQVSPALNTKQHLELDINDVFYRDNGQLSIAQHFPKAQSRDFFVLP